MNSIARLYSQVLGGVLLLIGVLGWIPPLNPGGALLGIFAVNTPHNLAHVLTGALGIAAGFGLSDRSVRVYTVVMSVIYGLLVIIGFAQISVIAQLLTLNIYDTLLHTAIFALSLLVCVAAFWEVRSLNRLQRLAPALRRQRLAAAAPANVGFGASSEIGPLAGMNGVAGGFAIRSDSSSGFASPRGPLANAAAATDHRYAPLDPMGSLQERVAWLEREAQLTKEALARQGTLEQQVAQLRRECETLRAQVQTLQAVLNAPSAARPSSPRAASYPTPFPSSAPSMSPLPYLQPPSPQSAPRQPGAAPQRPAYRPGPGADPRNGGAGWGGQDNGSANGDDANGEDQWR